MIDRHKMISAAIWFGEVLCYAAIILLFLSMLGRLLDGDWPFDWKDIGIVAHALVVCFVKEVV